MELTVVVPVSAHQRNLRHLAVISNLVSHGQILYSEILLFYTTLKKFGPCVPEGSVWFQFASSGTKLPHTPIMSM